LFFLIVVIFINAALIFQESKFEQRRAYYHQKGFVFHSNPAVQVNT